VAASRGTWGSRSAETVEDEAEQERLWALADRVYPQYADFSEQARKPGRVIRSFNRYLASCCSSREATG
jgi:hypothetical protein